MTVIQRRAARRMPHRLGQGGASLTASLRPMTTIAIETSNGIDKRIGDDEPHRGRETEEPWHDARQDVLHR
ncbi:hypothetical protein QF001_003936 [Paraburkholderia youngii]|uniref:hypothetical protein n=1 Tax=Paraburkholderia youngii TaxID=2782701 RepID=UPI003D1FE689